MSKKKDKMIDKLATKVSELEDEISRDLELVNVKHLESEVARLEQDIHSREIDKREYLCILEDVDNFLTTDLIPKLFCLRQADKQYINAPVFEGFEELEKSTFFMKTWVIDGKQSAPHHERQGYTKVERYPEKGTY